MTETAKRLMPFIIILLMVTAGQGTAAENQAVPDRQGSMAMFKAVRDGDAEEIKTIIKSGVAPDVPDRDGNTPLHYTYQCCAGLPDVERGYTACGEVALALVQAGANVNILNNIGATPLDYALFCFSPEVTNVLLESGGKRSGRFP